MEFLMLFAFAAVFAMGFNFFMPKLSAYPQLAKLHSTYAGQTVLTAALVFGLLIAVSYTFAIAGKSPVKASV